MSKNLDLITTINEILSSSRDKQTDISSINGIQTPNKRIMSPFCQAPSSNDYTFVQFNVPKTRKAKSDRVAFSRLYTLYNYIIRRMRLQPVDSLVQLATTSKSLIEVLGYSTAIKRSIDLAIKMGLLAIYDYSWHNGSHNKTKNYAITYVLRKPNWQLFIDYCKDQGIKPLKFERKLSTKRALTDLQFDASACRVSSKLRIKNVNLSKADFEQLVIQSLKDNYNKQWNGVYDWVESRINFCKQSEFYRQNEQFAPIFKPNITWESNSNKVVTKISLRNTNRLVAAKKSKSPDDAKGIIYRDDIRKKYGLAYEYDVVSSVPKTTYCINYGEWLDDVDCYEMIWSEIQKLDDSLSNVAYNNDIRNALKRLFMTIRFDKDSMMATHVANRLALHKSHKDYASYDWRKELPNLMKLLKQATVNAIGSFDDSEIFFHESAIYADVTAKLLAKGIKVFQVYDCWYTDKPIDIASIVKASAKAYYQRFITSSTSKQINTDINKDINKDNNNNNNNNNKDINTDNTDNIQTICINTVIHYVSTFKSKSKLMKLLE